MSPPPACSARDRGRRARGRPPRRHRGARASAASTAHRRAVLLAMAAGGWWRCRCCALELWSTDRDAAAHAEYLDADARLVPSPGYHCAAHRKEHRVLPRLPGRGCGQAVQAHLRQQGIRGPQHRHLPGAAAPRAPKYSAGSRRTFLEPNWLPRSECRIVPAGLRSVMALRIADAAGRHLTRSVWFLSA
jgi:hypothetical protein